MFHIELSFHMIIFCKKQFCVVSILLSLSEYTDALGPIACIWLYLPVSDYICKYLPVPDCIWLYLPVFDCIWLYLISWLYLNSCLYLPVFSAQAEYRLTLTTYWEPSAFPRHFPQWRPAPQWSKTIGTMVPLSQSGLIYVTTPLRIHTRPIVAAVLAGKSRITSAAALHRAGWHCRAWQVRR